jgi:phage virion morphogenesis protein
MIVTSIDTGPVIAALTRLRNEIERPVGGLKLTGILLQGIVQRHFRDSQDPDGKTWKELAPATIRRRRNKDKGSIKPLIDTGRLMKSINYRVGIDEVAVGTNVIYAATHNFGDPSRNIPERKFIGVSRYDEEQIVARLNRWVLERIAASFP